MGKIFLGYRETLKMVKCIDNLLYAVIRNRSKKIIYKIMSEYDRKKIYKIEGDIKKPILMYKNLIYTNK